MTKADGTHVIVQIGADYTVTATLAQPRVGMVRAMVARAPVRPRWKAIPPPA